MSMVHIDFGNAAHYVQDQHYIRQFLLDVGYFASATGVNTDYTSACFRWRSLLTALYRHHVLYRLICSFDAS